MGPGLQIHSTGVLAFNLEEISRKLNFSASLHKVIYITKTQSSTSSPWWHFQNSRWPLSIVKNIWQNTKITITSKLYTLK